MDSSTFLLILIVIVSVILTVVGIYLVLVLYETRKSLRHLNRVLSHIDSITKTIDEGVAKPANIVLGVVNAVKDLSDILKDFRSGKKGGEND
ncbi:hypothetical protein IH981_04210 [Patescibacteria group bacterium]|nr:hypothetical protein [Patescibacteria group bacterium]